MSQINHEDEESDDGTDGKRLEFTDTVELDADPETVWDSISDPAVLTRCVPGADSIERVDERTYAVEITRGVSKLTVSLSGEAEFVEMNPPDYLVTTASAFDSKTGSDFQILSGMEMAETDTGTALTYQAEVTVSGGVASMSSAVFKPIVKRDVDTYFGNVKDEIEGDTDA
jgi:hypothetical protein